MDIKDIIDSTAVENINPTDLQHIRQLILDGKAIVESCRWTEHSFAIRESPNIQYEQGSPQCFFVNFEDADKIRLTLWNGNGGPTNVRCYWYIRFIELNDSWLQSQYHKWISNEAMKQFEFEESVKRNKRINKIAQDLRNKLNFAPNKGEPK